MLLYLMLFLHMYLEVSLDKELAGADVTLVRLLLLRVDLLDVGPTSTDCSESLGAHQASGSEQI